MARRPKVSTRLNTTNLEFLGAARLAELLVAASNGDGNLKRRLQLELAAEAGPELLAAAIDKRLAALGASRARVSWRKRPDLLRDLETHRHMIATRLAPAAGLVAMLAWFGLFRSLTGRVKDPRGELTAAFDAGAPDLWVIAEAAQDDGLDGIRPLAEAIGRSPLDYRRWIEAGAEALTPGLARRLLDAMDPSARAARPSRPAVRRLADRAGDLDLWLSLVADEERGSPDFAAGVARRLLAAGRVVEARTALEAALAPSPRNRRWTFGHGHLERPVLTPCWERASIDVLEAEGRADEAQSLRWTMFERDLSAPVLRDYLARLADFDDVEAQERAFAHAAAFPDFEAAMEFLLNWPAHREAAELVEARSRDARRPYPQKAEWISRLAQRFPAAAETLGPGDAQEKP